MTNYEKKLYDTENLRGIKDETSEINDIKVMVNNMM